MNQDPGVAPGRAKGAAVHLGAMRAAFRELGADVEALDLADPPALERELAHRHGAGGFDLLYERYALGRAAAARWARAAGVPYVVEVNAPLASEAERYRGRSEPAGAAAEDRELFAAAARVVVVSRAVGDYAVARGADPARVALEPNGVDRRRFARERRREWGVEAPVPAGRLVIGFHGRLRPWHGIELLASVCAELAAAGVDLHVLTIGEGDFAAAFAHARLAGRHTHVGWLPHEEVGRWVALFDLLPLTYGADAPVYFSPLKLAEAMAAGAVPLVPDAGDLPEAIGGAGVVYPAGDRAALIAAVRELASDPARREALSRAAVAAAAERSWTSIAARVLECAGRPAMAADFAPGAAEVAR